MRKYKSILYILVIAAISSCVPAKLLDESKLKLKSCESELSSIKKGAQVQGQDYISLKFDRLIGNTNLISLHEEEMSKISDFIVRANNEGNDREIRVF